MTRYAFGRPIASFQAIKHKLADMYVNNELARSNAYYGAWALSTGARELPLAAAAARVSATQAFDYRGEGEHPDPWRHRLHLGGRIATSTTSARASSGLALGPQRVWKDKLVSRTRTQQRRIRSRQMDFEDSPEEAAFRAEVRTWLDANAKPRTKRATSPIRSDEDDHDLDEMAQPKPGSEDKAEKGYARITWPKGMGGYRRHADAERHLRPGRSESTTSPTPAPFAIGLGMCIPTLMAYGGDETNGRYVKPAVQGEEIWCQLFSEPAGGSDVAALRTKRGKERRHWMINGSKIWTTGAQFSDYGLLLTRTDPNVPKHKGLTMFYLSMKTPGVEVRPIKQASGASAASTKCSSPMCSIPDSQRVGEVGQGWQVALTTLMHERLAVGGGAGGGLDVPQLMQLARATRTRRWPGDQERRRAREDRRLVCAHRAGLKYTTLRTMTALSRGQQPGPEASIAKIVVAPKLQDSQRVRDGA